MSRLTPAELRSRLAYDFKVVEATRAPWLAVFGFRSPEHASQRRHPVDPLADGGDVRTYLATYAIKTLVGPGRYGSETLVAFDLLAGGNYPYSTPLAAVVSPDVPWTPHFHRGERFVCLGDGWQRAQGQMLFAELVVHVARLINLDEPADLVTDAFDLAALRYWKQQLGGRPITPGLQYPVPPPSLAYGISPSRPRFRPKVSAAQPRPRFVARGARR